MLSNECKVNKGEARSKAETKEEKRIRKEQIKQEKKVLWMIHYGINNNVSFQERRMEKKGNKLAYKVALSSLAKTKSGTRGLSGAHILNL
jgi:hypothetical protein